MGKRRRSLSLIGNLMRDMGMTDVSAASALAPCIVGTKGLSPHHPPPDCILVPHAVTLAQTQKMIVVMTLAWILVFYRVWQRKQQAAKLQARKAKAKTAKKAQ